MRQSTMELCRLIRRHSCRVGWPSVQTGSWVLLILMVCQVGGCHGRSGWSTAAVDASHHATSATAGGTWPFASQRNGNGTSVSWRALSWMAILLVGAAVWALLDRQRTTAAMLIVAAVGVAIVPAMLQPMLDVLFWPLAIAIILIVAMGVAWVAGRTLEHWRQARGVER